MTIDRSGGPPAAPVLRRRMLPPPEVRRHFEAVLSADQLAALDVLFGMRSTMQAVDAVLSRWLGRDALTPGRFQVMAVLWAAGEPVAQRAIVEALGVSRPTVSALVETLVAEGHASVASHPADARQVLVALTPSGRRTTARLVKGNTTKLRQALAPLSDDDLASLAALLRRVDAALSG